MAISRGLIKLGKEVGKTILQEMQDKTTSVSKKRSSEQMSNLFQTPTQQSTTGESDIIKQPITGELGITPTQQSITGELGTTPTQQSTSPTTTGRSTSALRQIVDNLSKNKLASIPKDQPKGGIYGFHGTARERAADEDFFDIKFGNPKDEFLGQGFYFTINPKVAGEYANMRAVKDFGTPLTKHEEWELGLNPIGYGSKRKGIHHRAISNPDRIITVNSILKGEDIEGNPIGSGQQIVKVDLSDIGKPFVVKTNKQRLKAKENIRELKDQGYDSILFDDFTDRSQQILVFPE